VKIAMARPVEGSRLEIFDVLQKRGSVTVDQLAREIGLASATVRRHLDILQRDHLVSSRRVRKKTGRPELAYSLTEEGLESGHRNYRQLLLQLLGEIENLSPSDLAGREGGELVRILMARVADQLSGAYRQPKGLSATMRLAKLEQALVEGGFSPEIAEEDGRVEVRLCNCPYRAAALCQKSICLLDRTLISTILQVEPVCQSTIHDGSSACCYVATLAG
jgi:predicted ArsR family transcriptional regulator